MTDENAMSALSGGDLDKAAILFERHHQSLYNFFLKLTYDRESSKDLTQQLFFRIIKYRDSYKEGMPFRAWLYQIARNLHKTHSQKRGKGFSDFGNLENVAEETSGFFQQMEEKERERNLHRALAQLDASDREILVMSRFEKMSYEEIAQVMDSSPGAIKVKAHRAIKKLRGLYFMIAER